MTSHMDRWPRWQTKRLWEGKLALLGSNRALFVQEEIGLTNVAGAKTYFFPLAKPLPKVYFYVPRNSSLFVLLRLRLLVSFLTSSWRIRLFADGAAGGVLQCNLAIFTSKMIKLTRGMFAQVLQGKSVIGTSRKVTGLEVPQEVWAVYAAFQKEWFDWTYYYCYLRHILLRSSG